MARVPSRPGLQKLPSIPKKVSPKKIAEKAGDAVARARENGVHAAKDGLATARANPFVSSRLAPGTANVGSVRAKSVRLPAPRELVASYRDGFKAGADKWLGSILPAGVRSAFGQNGVENFANHVLEGMPKALAMANPTGGLVQATLIIYKVGEKLADFAMRGAGLARDLVGLGQSFLGKTTGRAKEVIRKLLAGNGKGLVEFAKNLANAVRTGGMKFVGNIKDHLVGGLLDWLKNALPEGLDLPKSFDLKSILGFAKGILKLTAEKVLGQLSKRIPKPLMDALQWGKARVADLVKHGPAGLAKQVLDALKAVGGKVLDWGQAGAEAVLDKTGDMAGWLADRAGDAAKAVEGGLEKTVPVAIDFLSGMLGLGGVPGKVRGVMEKIRGPIDRVVDSAIDKAKEMGEGAAEAAGEAIPDVVEDAGEAIQETAEDAVEAVKDAADKAADTLLSIFGVAA